MATSRITVDDTAYVLASNATDALVQNTSSRRMRVIFSVGVPAVDATDFHILMPNKTIQKTNSLPADDIYVRMSDVDSSGFVTVS